MSRQHWYGTSFDDFVAHVEEAHSRFNVRFFNPASLPPILTPTQQFKIVITEFALQNPPGGQNDQ